MDVPANDHPPSRIEMGGRVLAWRWPSFTSMGAGLQRFQVCDRPGDLLTRGLRQEPRPRLGASRDGVPEANVNFRPLPQRGEMAKVLLGTGHVRRSEVLEVCLLPAGRGA